MEFLRITSVRTCARIDKGSILGYGASVEPGIVLTAGNPPVISIDFSGDVCLLYIYVLLLRLVLQHDQRSARHFIR